MLAYLIELRQRCLKILLFFMGVFILFFYYANTLFTWITWPLKSILPPDNPFIATEITTALFTPLHLAANLALLLTLPFALNQIWRYIVPALYASEKRRICWISLTSLLLFCLGLVFCYCCILPLLFQFFLTALPQQVKLMPDIAAIPGFITTMLMLFGLCFQIPLLCFAMVYFGWIGLESLTSIRPYVIVAAFILGMLLTPPDVFSQILLAIPLCLLYELGILFCRLTKLSSYAAKLPKKQQKQLK